MRKTLLVITAAALVALGGAAAALYVYSRPTTLRVAVPQLAEDTRLISAAEHLFSHQHEPVRLRLSPVADSTASAAALESEAADLAVVRSDFSMPASAQTLVILHRNAALLIAPGGSRLKRVSDLRGKRIGVVHEISSVEANARLLETIFVQYDMPFKSVAIVPLTPNEVGGAIAANKIDAIFSVAVPQSGLTSDVVGAISAVSGKPPVFIPISEAKAIAKRVPALEPMEVVQGAFGGDPPRPAQSLDTVGVAYLLVARSTLKDSVAGDVTRLFLSHRAVIARAAPLANSIEAPSTEKTAVVPVHQGSADYLEGTEHSFFEKYSDTIYIGAMLLSLVGSGAAALASRLNVHSHERTEHLTERLLEILKSVRCASTMAELDAFERETDEVLTQTLAERRLRNVEAPGVHLVTLALDQTRRAIEDQRALLTRGGQVVSFPLRKDAPGE